MKLTSKARYGLKLCYELGKKTGVSIPTSELSIHTGYSIKYVEKIMNQLKKAGIVTSERGASGGYMLSRKAKDITLGEIIRPLENDLKFVKCVGNCCANECHCPSHDVWKKLYLEINKLLDSMTLQEIIDDNVQGDNFNEKNDISGSCGNNKC